MSPSAHGQPNPQAIRAQNRRQFEDLRDEVWKFNDTKPLGLQRAVYKQIYLIPTLDDAFRRTMVCFTDGWTGKKPETEEELDKALATADHLRMADVLKQYSESSQQHSSWLCYLSHWPFSRLQRLHVMERMLGTQRLDSTPIILSTTDPKHQENWISTRKVTSGTSRPALRKWKSTCVTKIHLSMRASSILSSKDGLRDSDDGAATRSET